MAARKSCTHMTWSEAKNKSGLGQTKNKKVLRKQDHGQVLASKIIAKGGGDAKDADTRKLKKAQKRHEEKQASIAAQRLEEREQKRLEAMQETKPYDRANDKMAEKMAEFRAKEESDPLPKIPMDDINLDDEDTQAKISECKQMQLDEIMALEAMIPEEDFAMCNPAQVAELREKLDEFAGDENEETRAFIAKHPAISYYIKLHVDDYRGDDNEHGMDLNALILMRVTLPPLYLNSEGSQTPVWEFIDVMVTDKNFLCSADKPLESLAWLDEEKLKDAMNTEAQDTLLPYPCVYELAVTWISENVYGYLNIQSHLLATTGGL